MSSMLSQLQWPALYIRRQISRQSLSILYQGLHNLISLEIPTYITATTTTATPTRFQHPFRFNLPNAKTNYYHTSYFLKTFRDWNLLPISAIEACTLSNFTNQLRGLLIVYNQVIIM